MTLRVIVNGAFGKMGTLACETFRAHPEFELTATLGRQDNLAAILATTPTDIVVDLTRADCVYHNALLIIEAGLSPVIGTTGLTEAEIQVLRQHCQERKLGALIVPNFSLGALLMMRFAKEAARLFSAVEIIEGHHPHKWDAPSGTALKTAALIAAARQTTPTLPATDHIHPGARGANIHEIPIHAIRLPGLLAQQEVLFGHTGETLSIAHHTLDRQAFMPGLLMACQHVSRLKALQYGLEDIIFTSE